MRKRIFGKGLNRDYGAKKALFVSLATELIKNGKIRTTKAKAQAVQPMVEKLFTLCLRGDMSARRRVLSKLYNNNEATKKLFELTSNTKRKSGFTRIIFLPTRRGDNAEMAFLELTETLVDEKELKQVKSKKLVKKQTKSKVSGVTEK